MDNISPYFIRIRKSDLELPPATEHDPIIVPMKDSQRRIYDFIEERFVEEANKETKESALHNILVRAKMIRLQQVATNPALLSEPLSSFSEEAGEDLASVEADDASITIKFEGSLVALDIIRPQPHDEIPLGGHCTDIGGHPPAFQVVGIVTQIHAT